ncbi:MAG: hypothetical protein V1816_06170 [Pseudomonadota bacterium]
MVDRIEPMESCPICRAMKKIQRLEAARHFRNARKEVLMGFKSLIEMGIERLEAKDEPPTPARKVEIN